MGKTLTATRPLERGRRAPRPARLGAYHIYEPLGAGGQACVYRARRIGDPEGIDVALKRLHPHLTQDTGSVQAFAREARIAYLLDHPVVRRVHALCRDGDDLFMIMEYVQGVSLSDVLKRASASEQGLPLSGVLTVLHRLCSALHHAHELVDELGAPAGFVHRDVSPSNLMVASGGRLKLIDMGVARTRVSDHVTNSGYIKGKYGYMAPEVLRGDPFDRRADIFSAGVVAWELLAARRLFPVRNPPADLDRVRARPIDAPSHHNPLCPPELDAIVLRALAAEPAQRWPSCAAMADALKNMAARLGEPLSDAAIAYLAGVAPPSAIAAPVALPAGRPRFARGTTPGAPTAPSSQLALARAPTEATRRPNRRPLLLGAAGGSLLTFASVSLAGLLLRCTDAGGAPPANGGGGEPPRDAAEPAAADSARLGAIPATPAVPRLRADAPAPVAAADRSASPCAACGADAAAQLAVPPGDALYVGPLEVTRLDGPRPRSRSGEAPFRASLCIDEHGAVVSVAVLDAPERLHARITRALRRWRYQPYHDHDGPRAVCFDLESHVEKAPRPSPP